MPVTLSGWLIGGGAAFAAIGAWLTLQADEPREHGARRDQLARLVRQRRDLGRREVARVRWMEGAYDEALALLDPADGRTAGDRMVALAGAGRLDEAVALVGRPVRRVGTDKAELLDAGLALLWFRASLAKTFPQTKPRSDEVIR